LSIKFKPQEVKVGKMKKVRRRKKEEEDEKGKNKKVANNSQNLSKVYY